MKRLALVALVASVSIVRADPFAETAYKQAEELRKAGKWADACPLYEASYQADAQLGVLLHLADCHEHVGKIASAWAEWSDAIELAHKKQEDKREKLAREHADALAPKVPKLHLAPPKQLIPGLVVKRDGTDITVLVGTDLPIDPGDHEIVATAPGRLDWKTKVTITAGTTSVDVPVLDKVPDKVVVPVAPVVHEGTLRVSTLPGATIMIDSKPVGTGSYEAKLGSGGHTLRVVAEGMRPYQSEVFVGDNELRSIDVPLEKEPVAVVIAPAVPSGPHEDLPSFELGGSIAPGQKGRGDHPAIISYRFEAALRLGRRVNLGVFAEFASVDASGTCGTSIPGPTPTTPYDFGMRNQINGCRYFIPGLQLYIHILPKWQWDPYVGIGPGFRFGFIDRTPYDASGHPTGPLTTEFEPGILVG